METNWYAVHTKSNCGKKVASLLSKKGISNYYPLNRIMKLDADIKKALYEPLMPTVVFVEIHAGDMDLIKKTSNVISFVYWLGEPVVIKKEEIANMQSFVAEYSNIKLEKTAIAHATTDTASDPDSSKKIVSIKNSSIRLLLPSLGYMMVAESDKSHTEVFNYNFERSQQVS